MASYNNAWSSLIGDFVKIILVQKNFGTIESELYNLLYTVILSILWWIVGLIIRDPAWGGQGRVIFLTLLNSGRAI